MIAISFPKNAPRVKVEKGKEFIFCSIRKKWYLLTPEEWVRQNMLNYLIETLEYPATMIAVEKQIRLGVLNKRFDILVYDRSHKPFMIIECKEMNVMLDEAVLNQVIRYNSVMLSRYMIISNGSHCYGFENSSGNLVELVEFPVYRVD